MTKIESIPSDDLREIQTVNSSQTFEPLSDLIQNERRSFKRSSTPEDNNNRKKQQKANSSETDIIESSNSSAKHKQSITQPFSFSPSHTTSTITIGMLFNSFKIYKTMIMLCVIKKKYRKSLH